MTTRNTENPNRQYSSEELILEMIFILHRRSDKDETETETDEENLPKWTVTVNELVDIPEDLRIIKQALARRFSDLSKFSVKEEVAIELRRLN